MLRYISINVLIFYFQRFSSARNIAQEDATKKTGHFHDAVKELDLFVNSFGKAMLVNWISADAVFKRILFLIVINFIQVMQLFITAIITMILILIFFFFVTLPPFLSTLLYSKTSLLHMLADNASFARF